jgi:mRNA degradation ribonuclease J1/J2
MVFMASQFPVAPTVLFHGGMDELTSQLQVIQPDSNGSTSILIDPGFNLDRKEKINDPFHSTAYASALVSLLTGNMIPRVPGLWNPNLPGFPETIPAALRLLSASGNFSQGQLAKEHELMLAHHYLHEQHLLLTTQPHLDSVGELPYIRPELPLTALPATIEMLQAWEQQFPAPGHEFTFITERYQPKEHNRYPKKERPTNEVLPGVPFDLGAFKGALLERTSHFLGSAAVELTFPNGVRLFNSGDLGAGKLTDQLLERWENSRPDMLVLDATMAGVEAGKTISETELPGRLNEVIQSNQLGNWLVDMPVRHLQRLGALAEVTTRTKRQLYIPLEMAHYLAALQNEREQYPEIPAMSDVKVYLTPRGSGEFIAMDYEPELRGLAFDAEGKLLPNVITAKDMSTLLGSERVAVVVTDPSQIRHLSAAGKINSRELKDRSKPPHKNYPNKFVSLAYPRAHDQWLKWQTALDNAGINAGPGNRIHISDHIPAEQFQEAVKRIQPKVLIPIHSKDPMKAAALASEVMPDGQIVKHVYRSAFYQYLGDKLRLKRVDLYSQLHGIASVSTA